MNRKLKIYLVFGVSALILLRFYLFRAQPVREIPSAVTGTKSVTEESNEPDVLAETAEQNTIDANGLAPIALNSENADGGQPKETSPPIAETVKLLITSVVDQNDPNREQALEALARIGAPAVNPLMKIVSLFGVGLYSQFNSRYVPTEEILKDNLSLRSNSRLKVEASIQAIIRIGPPAIEPLLAFLNVSTWSRNAFCLKDISIYILGEIGDSGAVPKLIEALTAENSESLQRYRVGLALGKIGDERALPPLIEMLISDDNKDSQSAQEALTLMGAPAVEELILLTQNQDNKIRLSAINTLSDIKDDRAIEPLMQFLNEDDYDIRRASIFALGNMKAEAAIDSLVANLEHKDSNVRFAATNALGRIGEPALEPLLVALKDENEYVRQHSAQALGDIGSDRAVEPLMNALSDNEYSVRLRAAQALGKIGNPKATELLINALKINDYNDDFRCAVAIALGQIGDRRAVEALIANLNSSYMTIRRDCAEALGKIGDERSVEALAAKLIDTHPEVKQSAASALEKLNYEPEDPKQKAIYLIAKDFYGYGSYTYEKLVEIGAPAVEPLIKVLGDRDLYARKHAANALGQIGDSRAVVPLINCLDIVIKKFHGVNYSMSADRLYESIIEALGQIGDNRAVEPLAALLTKPRYGMTGNNVMSRVIEILVQMKDQRAVPTLVACLERSGIGSDAADALESMGWQPQSTEDTIHLYIARGNYDALKENWLKTKQVLLNDVQSNDTKSAENAALVLIQIGDETILPDLIDAMNNNGNLTLAKVYLNCGNDELEAAATKWALGNGYRITRTEGLGSYAVSWGQKK